jgi:heme exporter protein D
MSASLGPYAGFIVAAYLSALVIIAMLIAWIILDRRNLLRLIAEMEKRGMGRRSRHGEKQA